MSIAEVILQYWPLLATGGATVVWLVRLEGMVKTNIKEMDRIEKTLQRYADRTEEHVREIHRDIKAILERLPRHE